MYGRNALAKTRPAGWAERRRYFQRLAKQTRAETDATDKNQKANADKGSN